MSKGTPFFMLWEIHSYKRLIKSAPHSKRFIYDLLSFCITYGAEEWPLLYWYDYNIKSLW